MTYIPDFDFFEISILYLVQVILRDDTWVFSSALLPKVTKDLIAEASGSELALPSKEETVTETVTCPCSFGNHSVIKNIYVFFDQKDLCICLDDTEYIVAGVL